jgi:hypothetical protein
MAAHVWDTMKLLWLSALILGSGLGIFGVLLSEIDPGWASALQQLGIGGVLLLFLLSGITILARWALPKIDLLIQGHVDHLKSTQETQKELVQIAGAQARTLRRFERIAADQSQQLRTQTKLLEDLGDKIEESGRIIVAAADRGREASVKQVLDKIE